MFKKACFIVSVIVVFLLISSAAVSARVINVTKPGYLAAASEELLDKAIEYYVANDFVALQKLMSTKLVFVLKGGLKVYVIDIKMFSGKAKIRPVGQTIEIWTVIEAIGD